MQTEENNEECAAEDSPFLYMLVISFLTGMFFVFGLSVFLYYKTTYNHCMHEFQKSQKDDNNGFHYCYEKTYE